MMKRSGSSSSLSHHGKSRVWVSFNSFHAHFFGVSLKSYVQSH
jgi:hypothetical protein